MANEKTVVYTPIAPANSQEAIAPTKIDVPQYPDAGVAFGGYSKKLISQNQFQLKPQEPFDLNTQVYTATAGSSAYTVTLTQRTGKAHYIKSLNFQCSWTAGGAIPEVLVQFREATSNRIFYRCFVVSDTLTERTMYFDPPIKIGENQIEVIFSDGANSLDVFALNIYGWTEDLT